MAGKRARRVKALRQSPLFKIRMELKMSAEQVDEFERQFLECLAAMIAALADDE